MVLSLAPPMGGVAGAADPLPPLADPTGDGAICEGAPSTNPFSDLGGESAPTREVILCLVATGLTQGTTRTTYTPAGPVTRRQMALFIKRLADKLNELEQEPLAALPPYDNIPDYPDVVAEQPAFREAIGQLSQAEIVGGFPDRTFRPNALVSRRQMAAFVNRLQDHLTGEPYSTAADYFHDDDGDPGEGNLNALASAGIFQGDGQGNVSPGAALSRRQMANILLRDAQVFFEEGAIESPFGALEVLDVTPTSVATVAPVAGIDSTTPADDRDYTVTGVTAGQQYRVTLVDPVNIGSSGGSTTFAEDGSTGLAAAGTLTARIVKVNGTALPGDQVAQSVGSISPVDGMITFTVDGDDPEELVPVVYTDQGGANTRLNLDSAGRPTEPFGVGGRIRYLVEAPTGAAKTVTVERVTTERDAFVGTDDATYFFDLNDTYRYQGASITREQFSSLLSAGDVVSVTYDADDADPSIFDVTTDDVDPPSSVSTAVTNADGGATANDVRITYVRPATSAPGVAYTLQRSIAVGGADGACGTSDDTPVSPSDPTFLPVGSATQAPGSGLRTWVFSDNNVPDGCYLYRVVATSPVSGNTAEAQADRGTRVPAVGDSTRPQSTYAAITTSAGTPADLDAGDVVKIVFDEPMAAPASDATIQVTDGVPGGLTSASITNGGGATFVLNNVAEPVDGVLRPVGTVLTVTLVNDPVESPSLAAGVQRPATISGSTGISDPAGNTWDIAASSDNELE